MSLFSAKSYSPPCPQKQTKETSCSQGWQVKLEPVVTALWKMQIVRFHARRWVPDILWWGGVRREQEKSWLNGRTEREKIKSYPDPSRQHSSLTHLWHWSQPGRELAVRSQALGAPWGRRCFVSRPAWCEGTFFNHSAYDSIFQLRGVSRALVSSRNKQKNNRIGATEAAFAPHASGVFSVHVSSCPSWRSRRKQPGASPVPFSLAFFYVCLKTNGQINKQFVSRRLPFFGAPILPCSNLLLKKLQSCLARKSWLSRDILVQLWNKVKGWKDRPN